jgi:NTE family protein
VAGVAWAIGLAEGLERAGVALRDADLVVGTSAGAAVGAQLRSGAGLSDLVARQAAGPGRELAAEFDLQATAVRWARLMAGAPGPEEMRRRVGRMALETPTVTEAERLEAIADRLLSRDWPDRPLRVTAVDTATGEFAVWDRDSGVPLLLAVAASCAVPGVWPPVTIGGRRFMDGGIRSVTNADLAAGYDRVVVIAPTRPGAFGADPLPGELAALGPGAMTTAVHPDEASVAAAGTNPLDPSTRPAAVRAGQAQAGDPALVDRIAAVWA